MILGGISQHTKTMTVNARMYQLHKQANAGMISIQNNTRPYTARANKSS